MNDLRGTIASWVDRRIDEMLAAPRMWGSVESVEMQVLLLVELKTLVLRPSFALTDPRRVIDAYIGFLNIRFPSYPSSPLYEIVNNESDGRFRETLTAFRDFSARLAQRENPFEHSQIAIRLTFKQGERAKTSAITSYYEEFRRAARAASRAPTNGPDGIAIRRPKKDVEQATDFALEDAEVSQPNGAPGSVLLRLGPHIGQQNFEAENRVRNSLSTMMTMAEWAASPSSVDDLGIDDPTERVRMAVQTMRLVPSREIAEAAIGGTLVGRSKPALFVPMHHQRFLAVVGANADGSDFDLTEEVRAIDLDRGLIVLGKKARIQCFVRPEHIDDVTEVGVTARIVGTKYQPVTGSAFVLADQIRVEESAEDT